MTLSTGVRLGPYEILSSLGAGGMGEVYRARDTRLGRTVALKILPEAVAGDPERVRRFEMEARSASAMADPHIVTVFDVGTERGIPFIATELVEGSDLRHLLEDGPIPPARVTDIAAQIAEGLAAAHEGGVVHRDLKPENVLINRSGVVKIADFGLAKQTESSGDLSRMVTAAADSTATGIVMGTVAYMSPEQARGAKVDFRSDQFSLGLILYEMAAGRRAFARGNPADTLSAILRDDPRPLACASPGMSEPFARIVHRCLEKDPERRYGSTRDLVHDLKAAGHDARTPSVPVAAPGATPAARRNRMIAAAVVAAALAAGAFFLLRRRASAPAGIDSLAILPFENSSGKPDTEFLSDGITESLINKVSQVSGLRVISRASSFHYKGREIDLEKVGKELNVRAVLTGHVLAVGDSLSVGAELVDAQDGRHLWGDQYRRKMSDIFSMQSEIASEIATALRGRLTGEEKGRLQRRPTGDPEAYQAYLKGKYLLNRVGPEEFDRAREAFEDATRRDPKFALAFVGISVTYAVQGFNGFRDPAESWRKSRESAQRAIELDGQLPDGHVALAAVLLNRDWDWTRAESELTQAIALEPADISWTVPEDQYSFYLEVMGRFDEAIAVMKKAEKFDPLSANLASDLAQAYYFARRYDLAAAEARRGIELDPRSLLVNWALGQILTAQGDHAGAVRALESCVEPSGGSPQSLGLLGWGYGRAGRKTDAERILRRLEELSRSRYVEPIDFALTHIGLGNRDEAFAYLDKAVTERNGWLIYLNADPMFDPIRTDPRFGKIVARVGLPASGKTP
ncbi:MAG TPA: protein kinase [Thermoanaerobaculia bacterium]|nr:protein kinase [Thermoanaerobaculia bacterium]